MKRIVLVLCAAAAVSSVGIVVLNQSGVCVLEGRVLSQTELRYALAERVYQAYGSAVLSPPAQTPEEMLKRWPDCCILAQAESQRK